jgi:regulator of cell morphogenesis and NO signaling
MEFNAATMSIGQLALEHPGAIPVLDQLGVDYSCRGTESVANACERAGITIEELLESLQSSVPAPAPRDWQQESLAAIQGHIVATHHRFTRQALETVAMLAEKVAARHGANHPEVVRVRAVVDEMRSELVPHMVREEEVLFPHIADLELAAVSATTDAIGDPMLRLRAEHDTTAARLQELRTITSGYRLPEDACLSFRALYERLMELEEDLEAHLRLEHDLLFPRATALAEAMQR